MPEDKVSQAISENLRRKVQEQTDDIFKSLVGDRENSKLPEDIFAGYFLPHFSGQQPISSNSQVLAEWIGIAGTPTSEVDVIDKAGQTLFTVPSMFDTSAIDVTKRDVGNSISDIYAQFDLKSNNIPVVANRFLNAQLSKKLEDIDGHHSHNDVTERWGKIFERYGIQPAKTSTTAEPKQDPSDDLVYD